MTDIRLLDQITDFDSAFDFLLLPSGELDESAELATALTVALGTDGLASVDDLLPGLDDDDRRGWWGDLDAQVIWKGWPIGSLLWLLERAKITDANAQGGATLGNAVRYASNAIQPFVTNGICSRFRVEAERTDKETIRMRIEVYRGPLPAIKLQYDLMWEDIRQ